MQQAFKPHRQSLVDELCLMRVYSTLPTNVVSQKIHLMRLNYQTLEQVIH